MIMTFREMRRSRQALSQADCEEILKRATAGVLAVTGDGGYPYAVPLSYVYAEGRLYFHCAGSGHKLDAISADDRVSFCVIDQDEIHPEKFTTFFRSVILFGRARILEDAGEKRAALELLADKYSPGQSGREEEISQQLNRVCIVEITPEHMTGKEAIELVKQKKPSGGKS